MSREGRNEVGRSPVSRHSVQSYILTYYRLGKKEPLISLELPPDGEGDLISAFAVPPQGGRGADLNTLLNGCEPPTHMNSSQKATLS